MCIRFGLVLVAAALSLGTTRAEYEDFNDVAKYQRFSRHANSDDLKLHRPNILLPRPRPQVGIPENYPQTIILTSNDNVETDEEFGHRVARSISGSSFPRPGPRPQPSPTFPRPPRNPTRFRREAEALDDQPIERIVRSIQPYNLPRFPNPAPRPSPTFPRPTLARFKRERGGGSVSVDVERNRGSRPTTRVTAEQNVYKSSNGRTRVDASGYATNRGDRGGMINFTHRFR